MRYQKTSFCYNMIQIVQKKERHIKITEVYRLYIIYYQTLWRKANKYNDF